MWIFNRKSKKGNLKMEEMEASRMRKEEAKLKIDDLTIIDVREKKEKAKIASAITEDPDAVEIWMDEYQKSGTILLYCSSPNENTSAGTALKLLENGFQDVYVLEGGWNIWANAGYPTESLPR